MPKYKIRPRAEQIKMLDKLKALISEEPSTFFRTDGTLGMIPITREEYSHLLALAHDRLTELVETEEVVA